MRAFCTYFDHRFIPRGLALYRSLDARCDGAQLWVLCLDDICYDVLTALRLPNLQLIRLSELEESDHDLLAAKGSRSLVEYYFTTTPCLPLYIFDRRPEVDEVTYLDADLYFHSDPQPLFDEMDGASISIIAHRFPPNLKRLEIAGIYNVGWLTFKRDDEAIACLRWWRERCLEWCHDRFEDGKFADQKYLDDWPARFPGVRVLEHKGANLAPWNLSNYKVSWDGSRVLVDEAPLIFFHFHGLRRLKGPVYDLYLEGYEVTPTPVIIKHIYQPYICELKEVSRDVAPYLKNQPGDRGLRYTSEGRFRYAASIARLIKLFPWVLTGFRRRRFVMVIGKKVL